MGTVGQRDVFLASLPPTLYALNFTSVCLCLSLCRSSSAATQPPLRRALADVCQKGCAASRDVYGASSRKERRVCVRLVPEDGVNVASPCSSTGALTLVQ